MRLVTAKPPDIIVTLKAGLSHDQRELVWSDVLGRRAGRGGGHDLLADVGSVSAFGGEGRPRYRVSFQPGTGQKRRDEIVREVQRSPLVDRARNYDPRLHSTFDFP